MDKQLKARITALFLANGLSIDDVKIRGSIYFEVLKKADNIESIIASLDFLIKNWRPSFGNKVPTIAEIIAEAKPKLALSWDYFLKNMCNNLHFKETPISVLAMKKYLGCIACENMTEQSMPFLKKEFDKAITENIITVDNNLLTKNEAIKIMAMVENKR